MRAQQPGANRDAIGGWIEVRAGDKTQLRELTVGGGHVSGQLGPIHFGLGTAAERRGSRHVAGRRGRAVADGRAPTSACWSNGERRQPVPLP